MHPQYPAVDIKHLIDRLHTKGALRFLDLEITGPIELMPGVICEAAGGHTEGSMNVIVKTAEGDATICGDVIYDINDQLVEPFREISDMEPRVTGNHGTTKRQEKAAIKKVVARSRFVLPIHDRPALIEARPGRRPPAGLGSRPDRPVAAEAQLVPGLSEGRHPMSSHRAAPRIFRSDRSRRAGRTAGRRLHLHRRADLASARSISAVLRHAGRRAPPLGRTQRRARSDAAVEQVQRHDLRRQSRAHRLRARDLEPRSRARRPARVLASHFEGKELNSPNDVCVRSDGSIYFSDPWYGRMPVYGVERPRQLGFQGVYRVPPGGGEPQLLVDRNLFEQPNGLCFSPDERLLYVNDTVRALIRVFDVNADGTLGPDRIFASGIRSELEPGVPDGMKCDSAGNIWVTAPGGVWVYSRIRRAARQSPRPGTGRQSALGQVRLAHAVHVRHAFALRGAHQDRPACRAVHARERGGFAPARASPPSAPPRPERASASSGGLTLDPSRCALIIQDMQNDVMMDGGAFASSGAPQHAREQNVVENIRRLAEVCRSRGVMIIHVWFVVEPGAPGVTLNAPLFEGLVDSKAMVRGTWGAAPAAGLEPQPGDHIVEKIRMSAFEGSQPRNRAALRRPRHHHRSPAPGPICRSSTPRAPPPTRAISSSCRRIAARP